jgi:hypothetical protein
MFLAACVAPVLAGCGGGSDENAVTWNDVRSSLVNNGISEFDEVPPTGV